MKKTKVRQHSRSVKGKGNTTVRSHFKSATGAAKSRKKRKAAGQMPMGHYMYQGKKIPNLQVSSERGQSSVQKQARDNKRLRTPTVF